MEYLQKHDQACRWAKANRSLIVRRFLSCLQGKNAKEKGKETKKDEEDEVVEDDGDIENPFGGTTLLDIWHNNVVKKEFLLQSEGEAREVSLWLHRKGAAPSDWYEIYKYNIFE
jgi:release factor H-coupled RctB family protein